jgi:O-acetyl-ADP-ribose deacetylase (regulator of RNase III)
VPLTFRTGDLFASSDLDALAHGCNCRGVMGAGIAREFRRRWPDMYEAYRARCASGKVKVGQVMPWRAGSMTIYNLATQDRPGPHATIEAVEAACAQMLVHAHKRGIMRIGLPQIGSGIGSLAWPDVEQVLDRLASQTEIELVVHVL